MADINEALEVWKGILGRCALYGMGFLFIWAGVFFAAKSLIETQGEWFGLSAHEIALIHYGGMGLVKALILIFFLFPWVAVRQVLKKRRRG